MRQTITDLRAFASREVNKRKALRAAKWEVIQQLQPLRIVEIETNARCNRSCSYCPVSTNPKRVGLMSEELYAKIIGDLVDMRFTGGVDFHFYNEPLLDKRLETFVALARRRLPKSILQLFTNGDGLLERRAISLFESGMDKIRVSVHDAELDVKMQTLLTVLDDKYASRIKLFRFYDGKMRMLDNRGGEVVLDDGIVHPERTNGCDSVLAMSIDWRGQIALCCNDFHVNNGHGDLTRISVAEAWRASQALRRNIYMGKYDLPICRTCVYDTPPPEQAKGNQLPIVES